MLHSLFGTIEAFVLVILTIDVFFNVIPACVEKAQNKK